MEGSHRANARGWSPLIVLTILGTVLLSMVWRLRGAAHGVDFLADDAYYYVVIARNLAATGRVSFDGATLTTGFHPLLLLLEAQGFAMFGTRAPLVTQYLVLFSAFCALFAGTVAALLGMAGRTSTDSPFAGIAALVAAVLLVPRFTSIYLNGMESAVELPLLVLLANLVWSRRWPLAGVTGAAMVLARLDTLPFLILPGIAAIAWRERTAARPMRTATLWMALPSLAVLAGFALVNLGLSGHVLPISGAIKSTFPHLHLQAGNLFDNADERLGLRLGVAGSALGMALLLRPGQVSADLRWAGFTAGILAVCQALNLVCFQRWVKATPHWYLAVLLPLGAFSAAVGIANRAGRGLRRVASAASVGSLFVNLAWVGGLAGRLGVPFASTLPFSAGRTSEAASAIGRIASEPPSRLWAATDCGKLAFWSERRFVNLDGLVNDYSYQDTLAAGRLAAYLAQRGVSRLVFGAWQGPSAPIAIEPVYRHRLAPALFRESYRAVPYYLYSYVHAAWSDTLMLARESELWRSNLHQDGPYRARTVVFALGFAPRTPDVPAMPDRGHQAASRRSFR